MQQAKGKVLKQTTGPIPRSPSQKKIPVWDLRRPLIVYIESIELEMDQWTNVVSYTVYLDRRIFV